MITNPKCKIFYFGFLLFFCFCVQLNAQQIPVTEQQVRSEIENRGLTEEEVRTALEANDIDIDQLENLTADQILELQMIIDELEQQKKQAERNPSPVPLQDSIVKKEDVSPEITAEIDPVPAAEADVAIPSSITFGHDLFRNNQISVFGAGDQLRTPQNYVLGPGDQIAISIFSPSTYFENAFSIGNDGYIRILEGRSRVMVAGLTIQQAKVKLQRVFQNYYPSRPDEFSLNLTQTRTIQVSVFGEVYRPGPLSLSAVNNALNILAAAKGPTENGSIRKIQLVRNAGGTDILDLYKFMFDPSSLANLYMQNYDAIHVPTYEKLVTVEGAVKRPMRYELTEGEDLNELLVFAGGLKENALQKTFRVRRFQNDQQVVIDIPYAQIRDSKGDFKLLDGDFITISTIDIPAINFVEIKGAVMNAGEFERKRNMKVLELIQLGGLRPESRTDLAYLRRNNPDGTIELKRLNIDDLLANPTDPSINFNLNNQDEITIWSLKNFNDVMTISVDGAVRNPDVFDYDNSREIKVEDAINLAGGLRRDASDVGIIHRQDPLNPKFKEYVQVNVGDVLTNPQSTDNIIMKAFDSLFVMSRNTFLEESFIRIDGAVHNPGTMQYGDGMTLRKAITLAGGFKRGAARNNIEISRTIISANEPTTTVIARLELGTDFQVLNSDKDEYQLEPFDQIFVRYIPDFEFQEIVQIVGEVKYPGPYSIVRNNENISQLLSRAGGLTPEAFAQGATLYRSQDSLGYVVIRLEEVLKNDKSMYNLILKDGDELLIPKRQDFVTIRGATRVKEVAKEEIIGASNEIVVAHHKGKDAKFYVEFYAGGFAENADRKSVFVEYPNGEIKQTKQAIFWKKYPEVKPGSVITVRPKPQEDLQNDQEKEDIDWTKVLGDSVAQAMSILTLILLIQQLD
jgi:protein involved in polysaccharide export with SLBB domain